jgi:hypothetical protein
MPLVKLDLVTQGRFAWRSGRYEVHPLTATFCPSVEEEAATEALLQLPRLLKCMQLWPGHPSHCRCRLVVRLADKVPG